MSSPATLGEHEFAAALGFVRRCEAAPDLPAYRQAVLHITEHVPGHIVSYNEVDLLGGSVVAEVEPSWVSGAEWRNVFSRHAHQHPVIAHIAETGDLQPLAISDLLEAEQFHALELYEEFFRPLGVEDQIAVGLPSSPQMVLGIAINRRARGFDQRERAFLSLVAPHVGAAYLAAQARTTVAAAVASQSRTPPGNLLVPSPDGAARLVLGNAGELLARYLAEPTDVGQALGPRTVELLDQLSVDHEGDGFGLARAAVTGEASGSRLRAMLIAGRMPGAERILLLEEERDAVGPERAAALGLTDREAEIANLVARGLSNAVISDRLVVSRHTVKRHLERIYRKLRAGSRSEAIAILLS